MLNKLLKVHKLTPFFRQRPEKAADRPGHHQIQEENSLALRIVHAGGQVECYYMATPASAILDKHPSHVLAKPEVFRRPWDSVLRPDNILRPGQKFYLVPQHTVRKLRRRIRKPCKDIPDASSSSIEVAPLPHQESDVSAMSFIGQREADKSIVSSDMSCSFSASFKQKVRVKKQVSFALVEVKHTNKAGASSGDHRKGPKLADESSRRSSSESHDQLRAGTGKRRPLKAITWQPSLTSINESHGS